MIRAIGIWQMVLIALTVGALAQGSSTQSVPQHTNRAQILGQTGTMYDGNNANLRLPTEANRYWKDRWAAPISATTTSPVPGGGSAGGVH
jgi:hypothetical protein